MNYATYHSLGWPVFPVGQDKKPLVKWKIYQNRMPTAEEVSQWEKQWPNAGLGCPTGPFSNLFVVDIDGEKGLKTIDDNNAPLPVTRIAKTPRGYHYFFKWEDRLNQHITTISDILPGIDIRGKGGYVVVPSIAMPDREWKLEEETAIVPEWWIKHIPTATLTNSSAASVNGKMSVTQKIDNLEPGNRHQTFLSLAGKLMSAKLEGGEIIATLMPLAQQHHFEQELVDLVQDMMKRYAIVPKTALTIEPIESFLNQPEPVLEWMIDGLWTKGAKGFLVGQPNLGKTWVALDMLISYVTGLPCLGKFPVSSTGNGLLVEQEGSLLNLSRRFHMMARGRGINASALHNLHHMSFQFPKLPEHEKEIIALMKDKGIGFVVFDSLVRFHTKDENSSTDMRLILDSFTRINMETGASVMLIHHLAKQSGESKKGIWERVRGTSDFVAWRDCMLGLEGTEGDDLVQCSFQFRDAENPGPINIKRNLDETTGAISFRAIGFEETEEFKEKLEKVYEIIRVNFGSVSKDVLAKKFGGHRADTWKFLKLLESRKLIAKNGSEIVVPT